MIEPRDLAVQALYSMDTHPQSTALEELDGKARRLVEGVLEHIQSLDDSIEKAARHWRLVRMPAVDRAILRMALFELRYISETPAAVVISEAVRIAKAYSTERSGNFVNGVLAKLTETEREGEVRDEV